MSVSLTVSETIKLFTEFAILKCGKPDPNSIRKWEENIDKELTKDGKKYPFARDFIYNKWIKIIKKPPNEKVGFHKQKVNAIVFELGYENIDDYKKKKGYNDANERIIDDGRLKYLSEKNPDEKNVLFDKYELQAEFLPALISISPLAFLFSLLIFSEEKIPNLMAIIAIGLLIIAAYTLSSWISIKGKDFQNKYFFGHDKQGFPTTYFMLFDSIGKYNEKEKVSFRKKANFYFNIDFPNRAEELANPSSALTVLRETEDRVRRCVKSNIIKSRLIRHNRVRNIIPASLIALLFSIVSFIIGVLVGRLTLMYASSSLSAIFIVTFLFYRYGISLKKTAEAYAECLIDEFLSR